MPPVQNVSHIWSIRFLISPVIILCTWFSMLQNSKLAIFPERGALKTYDLCRKTTKVTYRRVIIWVKSADYQRSYKGIVIESTEVLHCKKGREDIVTSRSFFLLDRVLVIVHCRKITLPEILGYFSPGVNIS